MSWNYEDKLIEYIAQAQSDSGLKDEFGNDYIFHVYTEQIFLQQEVKPGEIYVVIKYLSTTNTLNATQKPIQILVLCEQNQLQASQIIFNKLVEQHNFEVIIQDGTYVKQDYREPVVLSNFNQVAYGYRSIIYISATLFVMEDVADVQNFSLTLDTSILLTPTVSISVINSYFVNGNREDLPSDILYVDKTALLTKYASLTNPSNTGGITIIDNNKGLIKFNNTTVNGFKINFNTQIVTLYRTTGGETYFPLDNKDGFTLQFLPASDNVQIEYTNENTFLAVFTGLINRRQIGGITESVKPINFNIIYSMTPNTQPVPSDMIATSVKSVATFAVTFTVPLVKTYNFIEAIECIMNGSMSGNTTFGLNFKLGSINFSNINMKMTSAQVTTAINEVPGLQIGLIK